MPVSLNVSSPSLGHQYVDYASDPVVRVDGDLPAEADRFDAPRDPGEDRIFGTLGEPSELKKPDPQAGDPDEPQAFVVPVLVAAGKALEIIALGALGSLIAAEIDRKMHQTNQTKPPPPPPQTQPPPGPPNPQAGIVITPLPPQS